MRLASSLCLLLLVSFSANADDTSAKRVDRMTSAGAAWMRHSSQLLLSVIDQLDPANCASGTQVLANFAASAAQDQKLAAELKAASAGATKEENALAQQRMMMELSAELADTTQRSEAGHKKLRQFHASCPAEAKALNEAMKAHTQKLEKLR